MANSNVNSSVIQWAGTGSQALTTTNRFDSDAKIIHPDAVQAAIRVNVNNAGTPTAGDYVDVWIKWSVDGTNYDTDEHAMFLGRLDTVTANDPGENPAARTYTLNVSGKQFFKVSAKSAQSTRVVTISAIYNEHRMA